MKLLSATALATLLSVGAAYAAPVTFDITLDTATVDGSGTLVIDDSFIAPNAKVYTQNVTASINFNGSVFSIPFSPTTEFLMFDALGDEIASVGDDGFGGQFVDWQDSNGNFLFVELDEGSNPGTFTTLGQGGLSGTFAITRRDDMAPVPLPAGLPLMVGALGLLGFGLRRKS